MFDKALYRLKILEIQEKQRIGKLQLAREIGVSWHTLLNILKDNYRGRLELANKTKKKIKEFIHKYER